MKQTTAVRALEKPDEGNTFLHAKKRNYQTYEPGNNLLKSSGQQALPLIMGIQWCPWREMVAWGQHPRGQQQSQCWSSITGGWASKISFLLCKGVTGRIYTNTSTGQVFLSHVYSCPIHSGSEYHRITESIRLENTSVIIKSNLYSLNSGISEYQAQGLCQTSRLMHFQEAEPWNPVISWGVLQWPSLLIMSPPVAFASRALTFSLVQWLWL